MKDSLVFMMLTGAVLMLAGMCMVVLPGNAWGLVFAVGGVFMFMGSMLAYLDGH